MRFVYSVRLANVSNSHHFSCNFTDDLNYADVQRNNRQRVNAPTPEDGEDELLRW